MHAVVRKWKADPARIEEAVRKIQQSFVPELSNVEGFVAYYTVRGQGEDVFTITICHDREGIEESTRRARAFADREMRGIIRGTPEIMEGEVRVEAMADRKSARGEQATRRG